MSVNQVHDLAIAMSSTTESNQKNICHYITYVDLDNCYKSMKKCD